MNWTHIQTLLTDQIQQMESRAASLPESGPALAKPTTEKEMLLKTAQDMLERRREVDLACEHYAKHKRWRPADERVLWLAFQRVCAARDLVAFVLPIRPTTSAQLDALPYAVDETVLLRWLLIDYWRMGGERRWIALAVEQR